MADKTVHVQNEFGLLWFAGWLFTLGYLGLGFWKSVFALVIWPYYIGVAFTAAGAG